jgi:SAM-dependent methyltransferase
MKSLAKWLRFTILSLAFTFLFLSSAESKPRDKARWDEKYATEQFIFGKKPILFLEENIHLLLKGKALDIAMGEGRNGVFLARNGFDVLGIDISAEGLNKAQQLASEYRVPIETRVVDLENADLGTNEYDLIICTYYLQRDLFPQIKKALKSGGIALIETYNVDYLKYSKFNKKYLLETNELLGLFKGFRVVKYQDFDNGQEAYSSIIAVKP